MSEVLQKAALAKEAAAEMVMKTTAEKNEALQCIADGLRNERRLILTENQKDIEAGRNRGLTPDIIDRLTLDEKRLLDIADAVELLIGLEDPVGESLETIQKENGLSIEKIRVPLGVVGMIYEARPNVTVDAATLCLKTGNAVVLRGSSSAIHSNIALVSVMKRALGLSKLPIDAVQLIEDTSKETAKQLFTLNDGLDVLIPRGGKNLIDLVVRESTVPVLETGAGNCHVYIDESADPQMASEVVINAKTQRPSVCNAIESLLIHEKWAEEHGRKLLNQLTEKGVELRGDQVICRLEPQAKQAEEADWGAEYLAPILSVKTVQDVQEAVRHIQQYGTNHSEAILTENAEHAAYFQTAVDAAAVYHNASTRFTDGFEFGYGAEIGISTQKLHARGPMGLPALTMRQIPEHNKCRKGCFTMSSIKQSMTTHVATVSPNQTIQEAAALMHQHNVGAIPVVDGGELKGMLTDRDIALRTTAQGRDGQTPVSHVMSSAVVSGNPEMSLEEASHLMAQHQIRRLPIVDQNHLVGIVALGDLAVDQRSNESAGAALSNISSQNTQ